MWQVTERALPACGNYGNSTVPRMVGSLIERLEHISVPVSVSISVAFASVMLLIIMTMINPIGYIKKNLTNLKIQQCVAAANRRQFVCRPRQSWWWWWGWGWGGWRCASAPRAQQLAGNASQWHGNTCSTTRYFSSGWIISQRMRGCSWGQRAIKLPRQRGRGREIILARLGLSQPATLSTHFIFISIYFF